MECARSAGVFVRHDRAGCAATGGDFRRLGLPRSNSSTDRGGEHRRSMEHRAEYEPGNHRDAEPDCERATDRDRTGDCTVAGGVDRGERNDTRPGNTYGADADGDAERLWSR